MFIGNESVKNLSSSLDAVWEVHGSVNQPVIALPDKSPEPTWAHVIAIKKDKKMQIVIYLFREQSREGVFYTNEGGDVELIHAKAVFNEALDFTGSMGFIMEKVELGDTNEQREAVLKSIPAFLSDLKTYKPPASGDELVLDAVYEETDMHNLQGKAEDGVLRNKGGKQWLARILSLF
ncbi:MAG: hypothetical protein M1381_08055 [Deltaproteobacteria bacterium]|nr:hypothetical protein [Deltaproteobacteria bacterium]